MAARPRGCCAAPPGPAQQAARPGDDLPVVGIAPSRSWQLGDLIISCVPRRLPRRAGGRRDCSRPPGQRRPRSRGRPRAPPTLATRWPRHYPRAPASCPRLLLRWTPRHRTPRRRTMSHPSRMTPSSRPCLLAAVAMSAAGRPNARGVLQASFHPGRQRKGHFGGTGADDIPRLCARFRRFGAASDQNESRSGRLTFERRSARRRAGAIHLPSVTSRLSSKNPFWGNSRRHYPETLRTFTLLRSHSCFSFAFRFRFRYIFRFGFNVEFSLNFSFSFSFVLVSF